MSWQTNISDITRRLFHLLESHEMSDVTLIVGENEERYPTHSWLLSMYSEVFYAMFYGPMAEKKRDILLPNDDQKAVSIFINYIYTDKIVIRSIEEAIHGLHFAEKYMITFMKEQCLLYLTKYISSDTVLEIYETAALLQQNELTTKCWNYIVNNASEIIKHDSVKNVKYETILKIVSEDNLTLQSELDMYNAVIKWGKERFQDQSPGDLRKNLEPLLQQIRFLSMTSAEFAESPCQDGILTHDEQIDIFREISTSKTYDSNNILDQWRKRREAVKSRKVYQCPTYVLYQ
ncbi:BTB/POZ domain-containing protein 2-like [Centruroides sculpturatus]|uniref:BTB/POZ domain-containing protein 2-like n=1 Tax=Centruroides sculpturatus TaxID=218467 RepID=UPI000C6DE508|nr:BTB/POZ domain-containing protein 2-like [Centruroides sculpturatus]